MSNMSYCRFQNTANDLADCVEALEEIEESRICHSDDAEVLSSYEEAAASRIERLCVRFLELRENLNR